MRRPLFLWVLPSGTQLGSQLNTRGIVPLTSGKRRGKRRFWNVPEILLLTRPALNRLFCQSLNCWGFIRTWLTWGKGNTQLQPTPAFHMGEGKYSWPSVFTNPTSMNLTNCRLKKKIFFNSESSRSKTWSFAALWQLFTLHLNCIHNYLHNTICYWRSVKK